MAMFKGIPVDEAPGGVFGGIPVEAEPEAEAAKPRRSVADIIRDVGITGLKGAVGLPQAFVGLADIPTGGRVGKALEELGYRPAEAQKILDEQYSPATQADKRYVHEADGFTETVGRAIERPATIATAVGESLPSMLGGAGIARGVLKVAPKVAPVLAGAIGEGAIGAGSAAEQIRSENQDGLLTPTQSAAAVGSGAVTGILGFAGGKLAQRLGIGDIDTVLASGAGQASAKGFARQVVEAGITEGVFEELPQSAQEQMWQNYATGKPILEGVGNQAAMGMLAGGVMGGAGGGYNAVLSRIDDLRQPDAAQPQAQPTEAVGSGQAQSAALDAAEVLGTVPQPTEAERALYTPKPLTALDRVAEIDQRLAAADLSEEEGQSLRTEREAITSSWPKATPGAVASFSTETGARLDGQFALMEAGDLTTSHDESLRPVPTYPAELQPRERERHASELQVQQIVQRLDPARLGESADAATGAPIVGADGLVESGNARTIALKRVYQARGQKAENYRQFLRDNAERFGLTAEAVDAMQNPVLVRVRTTPVNRAEFARQANAATVARMSPSEQAKADAAMLDNLDDLQPDEAGDFLSGASRPFVRRFLAKLPTTEQAGLIDQAGNLSQSGYARIRNAVLARAYGDSPVLLRMVESLDDNTRNLTRALMRVAPQVAKTREAIAEGALFDADITPDLVAAVEELSDLKEKGVSVEQALAQAGMFGDKLTPEAAEMLAFLNENSRSPRRIADFIQAYLDALAAAGNPAQGSMFGDTAAPGKGDLMAAAKRSHDAERATEDAGRRQPGKDPETGARDQPQPEDAPGGERGNQGDEAARRAAVEQQWNEALDELGAIVRDYAHVARVVPEDTPNLMPTLVKLFEAGIAKVGYNLKDLIAHVKQALRAMPEFKAVWNRIDNATYRKAAQQAIENAEDAGGIDDLFSQKAVQGDLFGGAAAPGEAGRKIVIDGLEYDLDADNFGLSLPPLTLKDGDPLLASTDRIDTPEREAMRSAIVDRHFANASPVSGRKPIAYVMGGGGASGKGTIKAMLIKRGEIRAADAVDIDPDEIKKDIPEYDQIVALGDSRAAAVVHEESSDIARRVQKRAMEGGYDIILDKTLGDVKKGIEYLKSLKDAGYEVRLYGVTVDPRTAVVRAHGRAMKSWRWVPPAAILEAHKGFVPAFEEYAKIADAAMLYENTDSSPVELASSSAGKLEINSQKEYTTIVERSLRTNERARTLREISGRAPENAGSDERGRAHGAQEGNGRPARQADGEARERRADSGGARDAGSSVRGSGLGGEVGDSQGAGESRQPQEGGLNEPDRKPGAAGAEGQGAASASGADRQRGARRVRQGQGGGDLFADHQPGAPDGQPVRLQQDGRSDGAGADHERRAGAGARDRAGRAAGIPAGRDIPAKSGRNYRFADGDLTYEGGWLKKAAQNVEAVELVKKLQAEGRQASREEQAVLAKFIGWGASEIRNALFGNKLDAEAAKIRQYEDARKALAEAGGESMSRYASGYMQAYYLVSGTPGYRYGDPITRALLEQAKPDMAARKWLELRDRLKAALTEEEWATAERSTQYAHYTSRAVVQSMWKAMERMGFKGGAILEPGAGIGVFPGLMDPAMATNSVYTGIEFDAITGAILQQLFPDERILVESFVDSALPDDFYDVAIGNPPFANIPILSDPRYKKHAFSLHDYFFAKSIDKVKPGGLVVYVTSRYTMDKQGDKARKYLAERADLVGAIRLPQTAFQKNAGTEVVTDVLFLRKKVAGEPFAHARPWLGVQEIQTDKGPALINEYFAAHPEMVLGTHSLSGSMYAKNEYTVLPREGDIEAQFAAAVEKLPADIYRATGAAAQAAQVREIDFNPKAQKEGNYYVTDAGVLMQREGGVGVRADAGKPEKTVALLKDFVGLRDALKQAHYDQLNDGPWEDSLEALQKAYRAFVKKHGNILQNKAFERKVTREDEETGQEIEDVVTWRRFDLLAKISDDPDYTLVEALETLNEETGEIRESKFLSERVLAKPTEARIETPHDALLSVLNDTGKVDLPLIAARLGLSEKETAAALGTAVYESPAGGWLMADEYLSGNVKKKLREAQEAARADRRFERNVEALLAAQPAPVPPSDITAAIGMNWIPADVYERFLKEKTGVRAQVLYNERTGQWTVTASAGYQTPRATVDWGTPERNAADILDHALTGRPIRVTRTEGTGSDRKQVFDPAATEAANQKLAQMRAAFAEWLWQDGSRADTLTRIYNDKFNTIVARKFDGRHLTLPGSTTTIKVFDHVKRGAWRIIQTGNTYLAHAVGSGKTWQMVISAMEQKRLGLINKPMVVVPNHMLQQFAREWLQLYPAARLMVADEKQFHTDNRRRFVARVAMSDLDGVIITHSAFKLLDLDPEFKRGMIEEQLDYLRAALEEAGGEEGKKSRDPKVRDIQNRIEKMEQRLEAAMSSAGKDKNVRFDQLGVDFLYVDEAHEYRKLAFTTQRQVKGIDSSGSDRAFDLYMKTRWLERKKPGRSLVMASGTPVTNTLAELYSVQRFMAPQVLEDRGLQDFDAWAAMFGQENTEIEADASGRYAPVTRFTKFVNVPELTQMFREYADVLTAEHLAEMLGDKRPKVKGGGRKLVITPQTDAYAAYKEVLAARLAESRAWKPSKDEPNNPDPIIKIIGDGRLAAIDMRFIDPSLPSDPDSKLNQMIDGVIEVYRRTTGHEYLGKDGKPEPIKGGAQMVFSDLGFGAGVAEHRGFNARAWFEKRLRDAGIPPAQVAFMSDYKKSTAKLKLFQDVNAGRVRILVGSSKNMGTGVNAQQRLVALHHLDTPWYPADLEQREGRIIRQGNKNPLVEIYAYSTKGSYDTVMWQMLASKQRFIDQALSGDSSVRSIDDLTEASQFQIATAMTAGDPRAIQLAGIKADIEKLQRLFRAHEETRMRLRQEYDLAGQWATSATAQLPSAEKLAGQAQNLSGENFKAKADGKTYDKRKDWGEALLAELKSRAARGTDGRVKVGEISGFPVEFVGQIVRDAGGKVKEYHSGLAMTLGEETVWLAHDPAEDPVGMAMRATNALTALIRKPSELRQRIEDAKAKRAALADRLDAKFQFAGELADKLKEAEALEAAMIADQAKPEQSPALAEQDHGKADQEGANPEQPRLSRFDRSVPGRMQAEDVRAVVDGFRKAAKNLPLIHVLQDTKDAPRAVQKELRELDAMMDAAGFYSTDGQIYLFASNLSSVEHAQRVFLHEAQHYGLEGLFGRSLNETMMYLYEHNGDLKVKADARKKADRTLSTVRAIEEVLADMAGAGKAKTLNGWDKLVAAVREWFRKAGWVGTVTDNDVAYLIYRAELYWQRAQQGGYANVKRGKLARATVPQVVRATGFDKASSTVVADFKNDQPLKAHADYKAAKAGDVEAAARLVQALVKPGSIEAAKQAFGEDAIYVPVHAEEASGRNKIPDALAMLYSDRAGGQMAAGIFQTNRAYHTGASAMERLLARAEFAGKVESGRRYVLVDDVTTMGSTLADLASYIRSQGGEVVGSVVLVNAARGGMMTPASNTIRELEARHGDEIRKLFGIEPGALTAAEAQYLIGFRTTDELRNRVAKARSERSARLLAKGVSESADSPGAVERKGRLSRVGQAAAGQQLTPEQRADLLIATRARTPRPLDAVLRGAVKAVRLDRLTTAAYEKAGALLDRYTPEVIKAGVVSDYGIPEAVLDQRAMMQGRSRQQLRGAGALIEKLATLTRAESRVAYEWLNNDDPQAAAYFEAQLPPESVKVLREVKELIDQLSREAVRLGQLDADTYQKNRYAYLRRSYVKHTAELTKGETKSRARAIAILGDQYRGRGMTDAADMAKVKAAAPEWWGRKLQQGKADKGLRGEQFIRLERRQAVGQGVAPLPGMAAGGRKARLLEVVYWPAAEPVPARYAGWDQAGTWEVRDTKGAKLILWRDFTKQEREAMGEIDEARFAIAKTLHGMIHDVETGRYLEWLAQRYAKKEGEAIDGRVVEASERMRDVFKPGEWVKVPDTVIAGTRVKKYGVLAGRYLPGPIWNDVRQVVGFRYQPLGETYAAIHKAWKTSKTALSPAVHMNNVMANFVMADWHDVTAGHVVKALRLMISKDAAAQAVLARYGDSGGTVGTWAAKELQQEQLRPLLDALEKELGLAGNISGQVGAMAALQLALRGRLASALEAAKPTLAGRAAVKAGRAMIDLYEAEDQVFRLAAWLKAKEEGATDLEAGKAARRSFLDYSINAPWVQMMRNTVFPFIAFTYRSVPMLLETAAKKPWKLMKLGLVAGALNALGYLFSGGDEDDERKLLPEEKAGRIWGLTPKLIRMPWNDAHGSPVFLDVRRWVPVGDIFDIGQGHAALPALPAMTPGGPLAVLAELALNKVQFTGKEITLETDTGVEKAGKVLDHLTKAFAPNLPLPNPAGYLVEGATGVRNAGQTYSWSGIMDSGKGKTDAFGREQSLAQAVISSVGIKVGSYPKDVLQLNAQRAAQAKMMEIDRNITALKREYQRKGLDDESFRAKVAEQQVKKRKVLEDLQGRLAGR